RSRFALMTSEAPSRTAAAASERSVSFVRIFFDRLRRTLLPPQTSTRSRICHFALFSWPSRQVSRGNPMAGATNDGYYEALWPRSPRQIKRKPLAKRLDTLQGKTIAQLWDYVFRGDEVFAFLE